ncbi:MAG: serine/threonine-protein kinase, partial [Planctomycetota bacterium]
REFLPKVGKDLDAVMRKLLHKDPEERYADGEALARDLIRVADGEPVRIRRQSVFLLAWRQVRKHPALSSAVLVAAVLFLVSLGLWRVNDQQRTTNRFQNLVAEAMSAAEGEEGSAAGPDRLLESLTGLAVRQRPAASRVVGLLEDAARQRPGDPQPDRLRSSYLSDPLPRATLDLLRGRGNDALVLLDQAISNLEARSGFAGREEVTWLELYRLYVARAVAKLSVTVSQADDASKDLIRASLVRPGAYFPRMLGAFLDWEPEEGADALLAEVDGLIAEAPTGAQDAVGAMLLAFSGLSRPIGAGIMPFELSYSDRRRFYERATALLGDQWTSLEDHERQKHAGPIEASLVANAAGALNNLSDAPALNSYLQKGQAELDALAPSSILHSWRLVFALLNGSRNAPILPSGLSMPLSMQLRGWRSLLELDPPRSWLRLLSQDLQRVLDQAGNDPSALQISAQMALSTGDDPAAALQAAEDWVQAEADNPAAYLCRFRCQLRLWDLQGAQEDAVLAFQYAVDPDRMRQRVSSLMSVALDTQPGSTSRTEWETFHRQFSKGLD